MSTAASPSVLRMVAWFVVVSLGAAVGVALAVSTLIAVAFGGDLVGTAEFAIGLAAVAVGQTLAGATPVVAVAVLVGVVMSRLTAAIGLRFAMILVTVGAAAYAAQLVIAGTTSDFSTVLISVVVAVALSISAVYPWRGGFAGERLDGRARVAPRATSDA
jgi:hypothetical protein